MHPHLVPDPKHTQLRALVVNGLQAKLQSVSASGSPSDMVDNLTPAVVMSAPIKSMKRHMCAYRLPEAECKRLRRSLLILRTRMGSG